MAPNVEAALLGSTKTLVDLSKRLNIPLTPTSPPGLVQANVVDPWSKSGKYALGFTYFAVALMGTVIVMRVWHFWQDKIRQAIFKQDLDAHYRATYNVDTNFVTSAIRTGSSAQFFPDGIGLGDKQFKPRAHFSSIGVVNDTLALFRWVFYRPIPDIVVGKWRFTFSSLAVLMSVFIAAAFVTLFCFLQQPLYWQSIRFGSPPIAIRSGMIALAMTPWIIATSMKANIMTVLIGIGPERLNVFHRWLGYLCLFMSLVHMVPFYIQPVWEDGGMTVFNKVFPDGSGIIYGTGLACMVPLAWLCLASLPWIRRVAYELFVMLHVPVGFIYTGMLFWHTKNYLMSWNYLYVTIAIWALCNIMRFFNLNWVRPWRLSFLVGDEAAVTLMAENCIKVTIPTQIRWKPGQYVYLRMPAISVLENHPFTVSSLCSEDFPSEYGENYRDCVLVFRPYGGFTRKLLNTALEKGPFHTYRAFLDGPYGGMRRDLAAFDTCILIAGGSGVTALMSQLLNLIKRMRDGKAITRKVVVVWAMKKIDSMEWFREELRICRDSAPPESVTCKFFITGAVRDRAGPGAQMTAPINGTNQRQLTHLLHDKLDGFVAGIASKRNSALIQDVANGDADRERELREENEDKITALPQQQYLQPHQHLSPSHAQPLNQHPIQQNQVNDNGYPVEKKQHEPPADGEFHFPAMSKENAPHFNYIPGTQPHEQDLSAMQPPQPAHVHTAAGQRPTSTFGPPAGFDFGFPETPTEFQKNLMRSAFPIPHEIDGGWTMEYGRPELGYMLKEWATGGTDGRGILGRRTAVFVCGPPAMRVGVANTVAKLQAEIWGDDELEEIFLHTENYAL
ncbi:Putative Ferric/cupric reductase transmembrane component 7 [[Torrubiella] hemipterigena]|uniref:ferric-chelate reductase (NADPH) n=1 Tax=[Torrubiella] hemipterigena TaxID=1531966 RepID=A0A0A1SUG9_9HYPO|nr:Putative Ferric/cupric reductase transmembrane component 7 [[Torrubiella] hemipterigena]